MEEDLRLRLCLRIAPKLCRRTDHWAINLLSKADFEYIYVEIVRISATPERADGFLSNLLTEPLIGSRIKILSRFLRLSVWNLKLGT